MQVLEVDDVRREIVDLRAAAIVLGVASRELVLARPGSLQRLAVDDHLVGVVAERARGSASTRRRCRRTCPSAPATAPRTAARRGLGCRRSARRGRRRSRCRRSGRALAAPRGYLHSPRGRPRDPLLGLARAARLDACRSIPAFAALLARVASRPRARGGLRADRRRDHRRLQRGGRRSPAGSRTCSRSTTRADRLADRRQLRRVDRPNRGDRAPVRRGAGDLEPARRQGRRAGPRSARRPTARSSPSRTRTAPGRRMRCASSCARSPIPTSRTSAASCSILDADGSNKEGVYWRYEMRSARAESRLGSVTGGNGSIYARAARGLRRGRPALRPRPVAAVPDGAARTARGLRARRRTRGRSRRRRTRPSTAARCACSSTAG